MDPMLLLSLGALALVDSTSFGTLLIPLWLMTSAHGLRPGRILVFLAVVGGFYFGVGTVLVLTGGVLLDAVDGRALDTPAVLWVQLAIGVALFAASFRVGRGGSPRAARWRARVVGGEGSVRGLVAVALLAATLEVATMLPYLGAIGLLAGSEAGVPLQLAVLAAYCVVMTLPAVVVLGVRVGLRERVEPLLTRFGDWLERAAGEATGWVLGLAGFLVARDAVGRLFL